MANAAKAGLSNHPVKGYNTPIATGMTFNQKKESLYVGSHKWIQVIKNGKIIQTLGNNLFNDIHTLSETPDHNFLINATGTDSLLETPFEDTRHHVWDWLATEHGYNKDPTGKERIIDRKKNYQEISTTTPEHTTHINAGWEYQRGKILATLFHQGQLVEIDKQDGTTKVLLEGLKCPHSIRPRKNGFILSDTYEKDSQDYFLYQLSRDIAGV